MWENLTSGLPKPQRAVTDGKYQCPIPRQWQDRSRSAHDSELSVNPSARAISSLARSTCTPIVTSRHTLLASRRTLRWMPSTHMVGHIVGVGRQALAKRPNNATKPRSSSTMSSMRRHGLSPKACRTRSITGRPGLLAAFRQAVRVVKAVDFASTLIRLKTTLIVDLHHLRFADESVVRDPNRFGRLMNAIR